MQNLTQASRELFRRSADERFESIELLHQHCLQDKQRSTDRWHSPVEIRSVPIEGRLDLQLGEGMYRLNDWSFSQLCRLPPASAL